MKTADYSTYISGKWHITPKIHAGSSQHNWPRQRGFDRFYGTIHGAGSFFDPNSLTRNNTLICPYPDPAYTPVPFYDTASIHDPAARLITEPQVTDPFITSVSHPAPPSPMHAHPEDRSHYQRTSDKYRS